MPLGEAVLVLGDPDPDQHPTECPNCGFEAVIRFPVHVMSDDGVSPWGVVPACLRCFNDGQDECE